MAAYAPPLHPARANQPRSYEISFRNTVDSINAAVQRSLSSGRKYQKVEVICLRWSNDDMYLGAITEELVQTFRDVYNFPTQTYTIPHSDPKYVFRTTDRILQLARNINGSESLLIVIYEGHAALNQADRESLLIYGAAQPGVPTFNWGIIKGLLDGFTGDVLVIMNACAATTAAMRNSEVEYLFASVAESVSSDVIARGFTQRLIDLLRQYQGVGMSVAQIHAKLVENSGDTTNLLDSSSVHVAPQTKPSISLRPFEKVSSELRDITKERLVSCGKVLISVRLEGMHSVPDIRQWEDWLAQNIPENVGSVKIQAVFDTPSSLVLLTVPIEVWDMMEDNYAYSFIDYVTSDNKCLSQRGSPAGHRQAATLSGASSSGLGEAWSGNIPRHWPGHAKE